jgi:hypothetical protein
MRLSMRLVWLAVVSLLALGAVPATASTGSATRPTAVVTLTDANFDELTATGSWMLEFYGQGQEGREEDRARVSSVVEVCPCSLVLLVCCCPAVCCLCQLRGVVSSLSQTHRRWWCGHKRTEELIRTLWFCLTPLLLLS